MPFYLNLTRLGDVDLSQEEIIENFRYYINQTLLYNDIENAFWLSQILENLIQDQRTTTLSDPVIYAKYDQFLNLTRWVALSYFPEKDIVDFFENFLVLILENDDFDAWLKLREKLVGIIIHEERDNLKNHIVDALLRNQENLTTKSIYKKEGATLSPTVSNWLKDYISFMGTGSLNKVRQAQYFVESKSFNSLSEKDKQKIVKLIHFYERCRLSSLSLEGLEESIPVPAGEVAEEEGVIREGRLEPDNPDFIKNYNKAMGLIFPERKKQSQLDDIEILTSSYNNLTDKENQIAAVADEFLKNKTIKEIRDICYQSIFPSPSQKIELVMGIAALDVASRQGKLDTFLSEDDNFKNLFEAYLKKAEKQVDLEGFRINPTASAYMRSFLKYLLQEKLMISENDAARIAARIGNLMKKAGQPEYFEMAYYDMSEKKFKWKM